MGLLNSEECCAGEVVWEGDEVVGCLMFSRRLVRVRDHARVILQSE